MMKKTYLKIFLFVVYAVAIVNCGSTVRKIHSGDYKVVRDSESLVSELFANNSTVKVDEKNKTVSIMLLGQNLLSFKVSTLNRDDWITGCQTNTSSELLEVWRLSHNLLLTDYYIIASCLGSRTLYLSNSPSFDNMTFGVSLHLIK